MQAFAHIRTGGVDEAVHALRAHEGRAHVMAGGADLMGCLKDRLWLEYPEAIIDLKGIPALKGSTAGAAHRRADHADRSLGIQSRARGVPPGLAEAARRTASPLLRNMGTLAGNICQENRCWYYRYPDRHGGRIPCVRKGGTKCLAVPGDSRCHSIFGAVNKCIAVNPSDTAPALIALDAAIVTDRRVIAAESFFSAAHGKQSTVLEADEIVVAVELPARTRSAGVQRLPQGGLPQEHRLRAGQLRGLAAF